jgi:hypothetical protein
MGAAWRASIYLRWGLHGRQSAGRRQAASRKARILGAVWTFFRRHAAGRNADACRERQHRGTCYISENHDTDDDDYADDDDDDDDDYADDDDGDDDDRDVNENGNGASNKNNLDEALSDGSDRAIGHDDRFDGFDEIVSAQLLGSSAPSRNTCWCSTNRTFLG